MKNSQLGKNNKKKQWNIIFWVNLCTKHFWGGNLCTKFNRSGCFSYTRNSPACNISDGFFSTLSFSSTGLRYQLVGWKSCPSARLEILRVLSWNYQLSSDRLVWMGFQNQLMAPGWHHESVKYQIDRKSIQSHHKWNSTKQMRLKFIETPKSFLNFCF